jgi:hypothetical protein
MKNISSTEQSVSDSNWQIQDLQGDAYYGSSNPLGTLFLNASTSAQPGETIEGNFFKSGVSESVHQYILLFQVSANASSTNPWELAQAEAIWDITV